MKAMQRRISRFEKRSVMLFAAFTLSGAGALHAQTAPGASGPYGSGASARTTQQGSAASGAGAGQGRAGTAAPFERADINQDGKLSVQEAAQLPALVQRFHQLDADKDGSLSPAEFAKGTQS